MHPLPFHSCPPPLFIFFSTSASGSQALNSRSLDILDICSELTVINSQPPSWALSLSTKLNPNILCGRLQRIYSSLDFICPFKASPTEVDEASRRTRSNPDLLALSHLYEQRHLQSLASAPVEDHAMIAPASVNPKPRKLEPLGGRGPPSTDRGPWGPPNGLTLQEQS